MIDENTIARAINMVDRDFSVEGDDERQYPSLIVDEIVDAIIDEIRSSSPLNKFDKDDFRSKCFEARNIQYGR